MSGLRSQPLSRDQIAWRAAREIPDGSYVNLGIGLPTLVANHMPADKEVLYHTENGLLGMGPRPPEGEEDWDLINAGKQPVTLLAGAAIFNQAEAFDMIRGGHLDYGLLGAYQVSRHGDIANWSLEDNSQPPGVGGAMDLTAGARNIWVLMSHSDPDGQPRILDQCTLPLTGPGVVKRIFTDLALIDVGDDGLVVREMLDGMDLGALQARTGAPLQRAADCAPLCCPEL
ncbi:MAG TPA: 3-oxoacid CoA-transferase subunit B [Alphaproteobacteria bacterium]|jgi:3-oxoadipate CoA-transferase beta subunit|nr:3-oxoacid CoA-transferase subunit B [Alphaproteobacteria bacterium]MDP6271391.1 3-oxoacid CoA-transferase subunit B [Alphaproteobacteria bacterium]HJM51359.1 3-oxoacid CoA-transferase subunit B [Alphaproteobacteria bacterium]|tara:strand:- start:1246 stop:1932 length:687 start_codon:yes stop_codon:yes gene_type:complete